MKYYVIILSLFSCKYCSQQPSNNVKKEVVLVGTALDFKEGAKLLADDQMYDIDNLGGWPLGVHNKKVIVKGNLLIKRYKVGRLLRDSSGIPPQVGNIPEGTKVIKYIILNATWKVYSK